MKRRTADKKRFYFCFVYALLCQCTHCDDATMKTTLSDEISSLRETTVQQSSLDDGSVHSSGQNEKNLEGLSSHQDKIFTSEDANTGLRAASMDAVPQKPSNVKLLEKMKDLMSYEDFISDFSILDSFDWFDDDSSTVKSRVRRTSEPYHYRRFQQPLRAYIPENSPAGTKVLEIPRNFDGLLEIVEPINPVFRIRSGSGILETTEGFDFEIQKVYNLIIRDSERNGPSFYNHDVIVYVTDENDNVPEFDMTSFTGYVNTASRVGSFVAQLNASDPDSRERGRLGFIIGDQNSLFTVNPRTWRMETNGKPLGTSQTNFPVNLRVFDQGYPRKESPSVVMNVNKANNPPRFSQSEYTFTYPESMLPGVVIGRVMAMSLSNIPVDYEIVPSSDVFTIDERGELSLKKSIDYENAGSLATTIITVRASELTDSDPLSSEVSVTLVVTNYDENPTTFTEAIYYAQIDEDVAIGTFVTSVTAMDCDCSIDCRCTGNEMDFTLEGENGNFEISETGEIRTAADFDHDLQNVYEFAVMAWDRAGHHGDSVPARAYVSVQLRDVNNNAPKFSESRYQFLVDEDSKVGHFVGVVQATDKDNLGSSLTYRITSSSPKGGLFRIPDPKFGIVVVASSLKEETESVFTLTIEASDGTQSSQTTVEINVEDVNDNAPQFTSCPESLTVEENLSPGARVTILRAVDSDRGVHANIEYFIEDSYDLFSPDHQEVFVVNKETGVVETALKLDREQKSSYFLISSAKDRTSDSELRQVGYCQFVIHVGDENDNYPVFEVERYETSVKQDLEVGSRVLQVRATDKDIEENARVTYSVEGESALFAVDSDGWITVKSSLQGNLGKHSVTIMASNTQPYHPEAQSDDTHKTTVEIVVTSKNLPRFSQLLYQASVMENATIGSTMVTVRAETASEGTTLVYYLPYIRIADFPFRMDHSTGAITLTRHLDFEKRKQYAFSVNMNEAGASEIVEAAVEINVTDVNDISPLFGRTRYDATVSEDAPPGTIVIRIQAIDYDPRNVAISYKIDQSSEDSHLFQLTERRSSIEISTNASFDRETREFYRVDLLATDNGNPQLHSHTFVRVRILDENDSPPVFDADHYSVTVPENTAIGTTIKMVMSRDKDYSINARAIFSIAAGNDGRFQMTSQEVANGNEGHLIVARPLDFEANAEYNLTVVASDAKFSDATVITVKVTKSDDKPPYFEETLYSISIEENSPPGMLVIPIYATDPDTPSSDLIYSLNTTAVPYFTIGPSTGEITTTGVPLDREKVPVVIFPVYASDGSNTASTFVAVDVTDVNEPPYFPNTPYVGFVSENQPIGTTVRYITAFDDDDPKVGDGKNSEISYTIDRNSDDSQLDADGGLFAIDSSTGLLTTNTMFNLESVRRNLTIVVRASDEGNPRRSGTTLVTIVVTDISEFPPKFSQSDFVGEVSEDAVLGSVVLKLSTTDEDFTNVGHQYAITDGNYPFAFYIEPSTGHILVAGILDYETKSEYNLTVSVSEQSISEVFPTDQAEVYIKILDSNDQPPIFQPKTYHRNLPEDVTVGTEVRVVTCSDADEGSNAVPKFSITSGNIGDVFEVVSHPVEVNLGVVQLADHLNREIVSSYILEITANDVGGLADKAILVVEVEDVNDTPPVFSPAYYEASIIGGVRREQYVTTINASDPDQSPNGTPLTFQLNNNEDKFQLKNPTGHSVELYTKLHEFSREVASLYQVIVVATDGGSPAQSAQMTVFVGVIDDTSNQEAYDGVMRILIYALDGHFPGGVIGDVYYRDDDYQVDQNEYVITDQQPGDHFSVDSATGRLSCVPNVPVDMYSVNVSVRDRNSGKTVRSEITVALKNVSATAVQHAVALRFPIRNSAIFVDTLYMKLMTALSEMFMVPADHVFLFSIAQSSEGVAGSPYGVDVWVAVKDSNQDFINANYLFTQLEMNYNKFVELGAPEVEIGYDKCAQESHFVGVCTNMLTSLQSYTAVSGYYGQVPAPSSSLTVVVMDTELHVAYTALLEPVTSCATLPCLNGGTCHAVLPQGYVCECPHDYRGPECQATTRTFNQPDSYIWLEPLSAYELSSLSFEFMSQQNAGSGLLLYQGALRQDGNNGMADFLAVALVNGYVTVAVSLGGRTTSFHLRNGRRLDDGAWHHVEIKRMKKEIRLIVDHCESATVTEEDGRFFEDRSQCQVISQTYGNFLYLNGLAPLQVGGSSFAFSHSGVTSQSFFGCIRNIYDNNRMYDLHSPLKVVNAPLGCTQGCQSDCKNEGYCEAEMYAGKTCCTCVAGFTGCDCSERSPSLWYVKNSFTEYNISNGVQIPVIQKIPEEPSLPIRARRHIFARIFRYFFSFHTNLVFRIRVSSNVTNAIFFRSSSATERSFSELGIKNRYLYYTCKFADEMKTVTLTGANITDDKWHTVRVSRRGNTVSLQLDFKAKAYATTGGVVRLSSLFGGSMFTGGIPRYSTNSRISTASGRSNMSTSSMIHKGRNVDNVDYDFQGCTGGVMYNGQELDEKFDFDRFQVVQGCPCATALLDCKNNSTCADEDPPYCACPAGFAGQTCDQIVTEPTPIPRLTFPGLRSANRHRLIDPVWICVFLLSLILLIFILCLLHVVPIVGGTRPLIEEDAHDSIMAYQEHSGEMTDATGYDVTVLLKHSRRRVTLTSTTATMTARENGGLGIDGVDSRAWKELGSSSEFQKSSNSTRNGGKSGAHGESGARAESGAQAMSRSIISGYESGVTGEIDDERLKAWIMSRVRETDGDWSIFPDDQMESVRYEGKYSDFDELSELEFDDEDLNKGSEVWSIDWDNFRK